MKGKWSGLRVDAVRFQERQQVWGEGGGKFLNGQMGAGS